MIFYTILPYAKGINNYADSNKYFHIRAIISICNQVELLSKPAGAVGTKVTGNR